MITDSQQYLLQHTSEVDQNVLVSDKNGLTPGKITFTKHIDSGITMIIQRFGMNNRHKVRSQGDSS
jgi:hypothetical protein